MVHAIGRVLSLRLLAHDNLHADVSFGGLLHLVVLEQLARVRVVGKVSRVVLLKWAV